MIASNLRFRRCQRVRARADFRRIFQRRCSVADSHLVVYVDTPAADRPRLGIRAGKRLGKAVARNRARRLVREAFRLSQHELPVLDMIVILRTAALEMASCRESLLKLALAAESKLARRKRVSGR